jgi:putative transcriptional regulator
MKRLIYLSKKESKDFKVKKGTLLIAKKFEQEEYLKRSVVIILDCNAHFTFGVVLNKKSNVMVAEIFNEFGLDDAVYFGGTESIERIGFLHNIGDLEKSSKITDSVFWCGDITRLKYKIENNNIVSKKIRFFAGFIEWKNQELITEINKGRWEVSQDFDISDLNLQESLWENKLTIKGNLYAVLSGLPDPVLN